MKNTRLIYIETQKIDHEYGVILEQIDNYLDKSKYLELVNNNILLYGKKGDEKVKLGREIYGREEDIYHSELFSICDFSLSEQGEKFFFDYTHLEDLLLQVREEQTSSESYRIKIELGKPTLAEVLFF